MSVRLSHHVLEGRLAYMVWEPFVRNSVRWIKGYVQKGPHGWQAFDGAQTLIADWLPTRRRAVEFVVER